MNLVIETGENCRIHPTALIGDEGFGYLHSDEGWLRRSHDHGVQIGSNVDIGAYSVVHRGRWRDTTVGDGTKLDAHVFVAHNVQIGCHCLLVAGTRIAGSTTIGDRVIFGLGATIGPHCTIGDDAIVGMGAVVLPGSEVKPGEVWSGNPARYRRERRPGESI